MTGIVTVRFLPNSFSDNFNTTGTQNAGETEQFYLVNPCRAAPSPRRRRSPSSRARRTASR